MAVSAASASTDPWPPGLYQPQSRLLIFGFSAGRQAGFGNQTACVHLSTAAQNRQMRTGTGTGWGAAKRTTIESPPSAKITKTYRKI